MPEYKTVNFGISDIEIPSSLPEIHFQTTKLRLDLPLLSFSNISFKDESLHSFSMQPFSDNQLNILSKKLELILS